jgi:hypothetical protein
LVKSKDHFFFLLEAESFNMFCFVFYV